MLSGSTVSAASCIAAKSAGGFSAKASGSPGKASVPGGSTASYWTNCGTRPSRHWAITRPSPSDSSWTGSSFLPSQSARKEDGSLRVSGVISPGAWYSTATSPSLARTRSPSGPPAKQTAGPGPRPAPGARRKTDRKENAKRRVMVINGIVPYGGSGWLKRDQAGTRRRRERCGR
jgi:hypothetical protein